jgi:uncharacterized glyoxalase superfamily protein PhnB
MEKIIPNLMVSDMQRSLGFYCDLLGFTQNMAVTGDRKVITDGERVGNIVFAMLVNDSAELMLQRRDSMMEDVPAFSPGCVPGGTITLYLRGEAVDELAAKLAGAVEVVKGPETSWYGMRELYIRDPDGYVLAFGTPQG